MLGVLFRVYRSFGKFSLTALIAILISCAAETASIVDSGMAFDEGGGADASSSLDDGSTAAPDGDTSDAATSQVESLEAAVGRVANGGLSDEERRASSALSSIDAWKIAYVSNLDFSSIDVDVALGDPVVREVFVAALAALEAPEARNTVRWNWTSTAHADCGATSDQCAARALIGAFVATVGALGLGACAAEIAATAGLGAAPGVVCMAVAFSVLRRGVALGGTTCLTAALARLSSVLNDCTGDDLVDQAGANELVCGSDCGAGMCLRWYDWLCRSAGTGPCLAGSTCAGEAPCGDARYEGLDGRTWGFCP